MAILAQLPRYQRRVLFRRHEWNEENLAKTEAFAEYCRELQFSPNRSGLFVERRTRMEGWHESIA